MRVRILGVLKIVCCCTINPDCRLRLLWSQMLSDSAACSLPLHSITIIKMICRAPICHTSWECRARYNNTHSHPPPHHTHTHTHTHTTTTTHPTPPHHPRTRQMKGYTSTAVKNNLEIVTEQAALKQEA